jgi:hypothetical protein
MWKSPSHSFSAVALIARSVYAGTLPLAGVIVIEKRSSAVISGMYFRGADVVWLVAYWQGVFFSSKSSREV